MEGEAVRHDLSSHHTPPSDGSSSSASSADQKNNRSPAAATGGSCGEPVRSRWTPKPEQILILESIFNSGMVNPPKDETVRIRKLLERFGAVGDANVFYWFQNRRSRSRRRQRQLQASLQAAEQQQQQQQMQLLPRPPPPLNNNAIQNINGGGVQHDHQYGNYNTINTGVPLVSGGAGGLGLDLASFSHGLMVGSSSTSSSSSSGGCGGVDIGGGSTGCVDDVYTVTTQMVMPEMVETAAGRSAWDTSPTMSYQSGIITVFINGVPTEVPGGIFDIKAMFGQDIMLIHSSGVPVPTSEYGFSLQSLQHGESYFLVSRLG